MVSNPDLDFEHYTVAWIAPLEIEAQAALYMLDNEHKGNFTTHRGDDYVYMAGDINGHNVIIATFPAGHDYGVGSAAALASQVKKSFPNLWFGLSVGVAAGLPDLSRTPPRDIRLGDVIVGVGDGESAGLVSYGSGKETSTEFELLHHGAQAKTETIVRSAIGSIKALAPMPMHRNAFLQYYESIKDKQHSSGTFADPGQERDQLYQTVDEENGSVTKLVERPLRPLSERTRVWYGPIGSGDKLMKNAKKRDELRDKFNLIGLEMEAAGIMNAIPVGVIRGVCNYGDAQKNKEWQPYAAAIAAAYAKAVLYKIRPEKNRREETLQAHKALATQQLSEVQKGISVLISKEHRPKLHNIPSQKIPYFIGRKAILNDIKRYFASQPQGTRYNAVVLLGMGGQGKTQIALEYCQQKRKEYDYILWADADDENTMKQSFEQFARRLGRHSGATGSVLLGDPETDKLGPSNNLSSLDIVKDVLSDSRFLLIMDSLDNPNAIQNVKDFIPVGDHGHIIITSRHADTIQLGTRLQVDSMTLEDAIELLTIRSERDEVRENAINLVETLGRLPLAIDQAASYIRYTRYSFQRFIQEFDKRKDILLDSDLPIFWDYKKKRKSGKDNIEIDEKLGVWTTWQLSLNLLEARNNGVSMAHLLTLSAFLNGRNISQATLIPWLKYIGNSINIFPWDDNTVYTGSGSYDFAQRTHRGVNKSLFEDNELIENKFLQFVADAYNLSLIQTLTHGKRGACYSIHPLITEWLRRRLHENDYREYIYDSIFAVEIFLNQDEVEGESIEMVHEMLGHVRACFQNSTQLGESDDRLGAGSLREAGLKMCYFLGGNGIGTDNEVERILRIALNATPGYWDGDLKLLNRSPLSMLGLICFKKKELSEAAMFYEELLSLSERFYGDAHTLKALTTLCDIYIMQQNPQKAYSCVLDVFANWEKSFTDENNLWEWTRLLGEFPAHELRGSHAGFAVKLLEDLASLVNSSNQVRSKYTQGILYNSAVYHLGRALLLCQQYDQAGQSFSETLRRLSDLPRGDEAFLLTLKCLSHLSALKILQGKEDESEAFQRQIVELLGDQDFRGRPAIEAVRRQAFLNMISGLTRSTAVIHVDTAILSFMSFKDQLPVVKINTLKSLTGQLSVVLFSGEPHKELYASLEKALVIVERLFGPADAEVIRSKRLMAMYLFGVEDYEEALRIWEEVLEFDPTQDETEVLFRVRCKARCLRRLGRYSEYEALKARFPETDWLALEDEEAQLMAE